MSNRHKYAMNGVCVIENAREHIERNDFPQIPIGTAGGFDGWYLTMQRDIIDNVVYYYPFIYTFERRTKVSFLKYFSILKNDGSSDILYENLSYLESTRGSNGKNTSVGQLLNEENGYLTNGGIKIEYGLQIEGILSPYNIWTFNFHDPLFECQEKLNMISFYKEYENDKIKSFHCHKQLLTHHSTYFNSDSKENQTIELTDENPMFFEYFLQFSHGVRIKVYPINFEAALEYAHKYNLFNVIQLIDQYLVLSGWYSEPFLLDVIPFGLKHYLANFLKKQKTSKELAEKMKNLDLEAMSGEAMKKCVKRFFEF